MATRTDYIYNDTNDIQVINGGFLVSDSLMQEAKMGIVHPKGNYRQTPTYGVGIINYMGSSINSLILNNIISQELIKDRLSIKDFNYSTTGTENLNLQMVVKLV